MIGQSLGRGRWLPPPEIFIRIMIGIFMNNLILMRGRRLIGGGAREAFGGQPGDDAGCRPSRCRIPGVRERDPHNLSAERESIPHYHLAHSQQWALV